MPGEGGQEKEARRIRPGDGGLGKGGQEKEAWRRRPGEEELEKEGQKKNVLTVTRVMEATMMEQTEGEVEAPARVKNLQMKHGNGRHFSSKYKQRQRQSVPISCFFLAYKFSFIRDK